jgi:hypothetical protein
MTYDGSLLARGLVTREFDAVYGRPRIPSSPIEPVGRVYSSLPSIGHRHCVGSCGMGWGGTICRVGRCNGQRKWYLITVGSGNSSRWPLVDLKTLVSSMLRILEVGVSSLLQVQVQEIMDAL